MNLEKFKGQMSFFRIVLLSLLFLTGIILFYSLLLFILFQIYKDDISKIVLTSVNQKINGELAFSDVSFTPLRYFPNASIKFSDLSLKESKDTISTSGHPPVFEINEAYVSVNIIDLFSSQINASKMAFENGSINVVVYPDSQTNIEKAFKRISSESKVSDKVPIQTDTTTTKKQIVVEDKSGLNIQIENLELINILVNAENLYKKNKIQLKINEFQSDLVYQQKKINSSIKLDCKIDSLIKDNFLIARDLQLNLNSGLEIDSESIRIKIEDGNFAVEQAQFQFNGIFDSENQGLLDLSIKGSDKDFSLFSFLLRDEGLKNIKSGNADLKARIIGKTYVEFPSIGVSFEVKNVDLANPVTNREIKNLNIKANFLSGDKEDWSNAELKIDTLYAALPDGNLNFSCLIRNFKYPEIDANIFLSADVTGFEQVFNLGQISDLKGKIEISDKLKGNYNIEEKMFVSDLNNATISFEDFGLRIPGTILLDSINGVITRNNDDVQFVDFKVVSEDTDILINGEVKNAMALVFNREDEITGDLQIKANVFDLPNFLFFDPSIKRDFNHRILDVDVDVIAKTTTSKATKFKSFPEIDFEIRKIDATTEGFLPRIEINSGVFRISENILGFNLKFNEFRTDFLNGKFNFTGEYNTSKHNPYYIKMKADFDAIFLSELFYNENDTIPESLNGELSGSFFSEFQFPTDTTILNFINLKNADLTYELPEDTITAKNLTISLNKIYFDEVLDPNPFATFYTTGRLKADNIKSNSFNFNEINFSVSAVKGFYEIRSDVVKIFGENAKGKSVITAKPFGKVPEYNIKYNDVNFQAEKMLTAFNEEPVISGPLVLSFDVDTKGSDWDEIVKNLEGKITLSGHNLTLIGFDADEMIENFKRSQNFNLVDLGGVLLAGPVGLAVTKGSDFARIFVFNSGKSTNIVKMVSNWTIDSGEFKIEDAAFTTNKNRVALVGAIGFSEKMLNLTVALLNQKGCSIFSQDIYGDLNSPQLGKVKVVGTVLAPLTNLVDGVTKKDCVVFYNGLVEHPK